MDRRFQLRFTILLAFFLPLLIAQQQKPVDPVLFGSGRFRLEQSNDSFGMRSHGILEQFGAKQTKFYPLPQSTADEYNRLRPEDRVRNGSKRPIEPQEYERQEVIGPHQTEDGRIWFGKRYYDSEGMRGVGAFGYFDFATRSYQLFSPRAIAGWGISAILVQPDKIWLGLDEFGEDIATVPGGLARWDRVTHAVQRYPLEFVVNRIRPEGDSLRLETSDGYAVFHDGTFRRFLANGTPVARFPPRPTHY
jgi:hypothetical protein